MSYGQRNLLFLIIKSQVSVGFGLRFYVLVLGRGRDDFSCIIMDTDLTLVSICGKGQIKLTSVSTYKEPGCC